MSQESAKRASARVVGERLAELSSVRSRLAGDARASARRRALRQWQSRRLSLTYPDLLASARYGAAARFFQEDLYGCRDNSRRDADLEKVIPMLVRFLPLGALDLIGRALELDLLSEALDAAVAAHLTAGPIDEKRYAAAYRAVGRRSDRAHQLRLVGEIGRSLNHLVHVPLLGGTLRMMHGPARLLGVAGLHDFLQRGYDAFRRIGDATPFLEIIETRERDLLELWLASDAALAPCAP